MIPAGRDEILSRFAKELLWFSNYDTVITPWLYFCCHYLKNETTKEVICKLGGDYIILVGRDEILYRFAGILVVLQTLHKLYPAITCKKFHSGKAGFLFCTAGILFCWDKIFLCNRFNPPKRDEKVN